jgi:hypothetical protein
MKLKLILIGIAIVLASSWWMQTRRLVKMTEERDRINNNYQEQVEGLNKNLNLTKKEFKNLLKKNSELDSLLKAEKIRKNKVEYVTVVKTDYKVEYVPVEIIKRDTTKYTVWYSDKCLSFNGVVDVSVPSFMMEEILFNNKTSIVGYKKKKDTGRRVLWVFKVKKEYIEIHASSKCGETTVETLNIID